MGFSGNMDISKAKKLLGFLPTPADEAFEKTISFYEEAFLKFSDRRDDLLSQMFQDIIPYSRGDNVYMEIDKLLTASGYNNNEFRKMRKGEMEQLPTSTSNKQEL